MKTKFGLFAAFLVVLFAGFASAKPVGIIKPELHFDIPQEVLNLTNPNLVTLTPELTNRASVIYADMKDELRTKTKYNNGLSFHNASGQEVLIVVNGNPVYFERDGMKKGLMTMVNKSAMPISFDWFEKYGDLLVVGMFPLESGNKIIRGYVFAVRFQDLIDSQGNLRRFSQAIGPGTPPLAHVRPYYAKPTAKQYQLAKAIELKPGSKPLVIVRNSNSGPIVEMEQVKVSPKNAETFVVSDQTLASDSSVNDWAKIRRVVGAEGKVVSLLVERVTECSPYDLAGLRAGMQILGYEQKAGDLYLRVSRSLENGLVVEDTLFIDAQTIRLALAPALVGVAIAQSQNMVASVSAPREE